MFNLDLHNPVVALSGASLTTKLLKDLCFALSRLDNVTKLDLASNQLGDAGAEILAELLSEKPQIVHINLKSNGIADVGVSMLCRALSRHGTCRSLILGSNPVSDIGLAELSKFVVSSNEIELLDLMDTPISLRGTLAFADALVRNESLTTLRLPHVLGHRVLTEVERLMRRNFMRRNHMDERRAEAAIRRVQDEQQSKVIAKQWRSTQPQARPLPPSSGFTLQEWSDKDLAPILMHLEILDRKVKLNKKREAMLLNDDDDYEDELRSSMGLMLRSPLQSVVSSRVPALPKSALSQQQNKPATVRQLQKNQPGWGSARKALQAATASQIPRDLPPVAVPSWMGTGKIGAERKCW